MLKAAGGGDCHGLHCKVDLLVDMKLHKLISSLYL